ncbi:MAG TPA: hypothetical protein VM030_01200 [Acidimicrobiales bacterium]|nr:hypothetical protein [Acidimicrobiales bacterium]
MAAPDAKTPLTGRPADKSLPVLAGELWEMVIAYVKQETLEPVKGLARFVAFGMAGSAALAIGLVVLALAGLRALQTETGTVFQGNLSWAPYLITVTGCGVVAFLAVISIGRKS